MSAKDFLKKIRRYFVIEKIKQVQIPVMEGSYLRGHTALICGGTGGIGYAIAERFIANGCKVVISGTSEEKLRKACNSLGGETNFVVLDLRNISQTQNSLNDFLSHYKDVNKIDILVNAAGIHGPSDFWNITENDFNSVMEINVRGIFFVCQVIGTYMKENGIKGHILNISSASALKPGKTPYEISKNAVRSMTLGMADEMIKYGIVVNCLAPGPVATPMLNKDRNSSLTWEGNPSGRLATPDEIANWAVFMASGLGDYIVGNSLYISGGSGTICIDR